MTPLEDLVTSQKMKEENHSERTENRGMILEYLPYAAELCTTELKGHETETTDAMEVTGGSYAACLLDINFR